MFMTETQKIYYWDNYYAENIDIDIDSVCRNHIW